MIGAGDALEFVISQFAVGAVDKDAELSGVDEEGLAVAFSELAVCLATSQKPEADGDLCGVEELARESDHAVDEVFFDEAFADLPFAGGVAAHRAVGEDKACDAGGGEVVDHVLDPGEVGVANGGRAELPAGIFAEVLTAPVGDVEGGIGENEVSLEVFVEVAAKRIGVLGAEVGVDATDRKVHLAQAPGRVVAFLAIDGEVADASAMRQDKFFTLNEHPAGTAAGVVDAAFVGFDHLNEELDDRLRRVELPSPFPFGAGELAEEVFVNAAEDVFAAGFGIPQADFGEEVDEFAEALFIEGGSGVVFGEDAFEGRVVFLDEGHRLIDELADVVRFVFVVGVDVAGFGVIGDKLPAGFIRDPEDILGEVFVAVFGIGKIVFGELIVEFLEGIGDVFEEDQAEDNVLVFGGVHVSTEQIGGRPEGLFEAEVGGGIVGLGFVSGGFTWHCR